MNVYDANLIFDRVRDNFPSNLALVPTKEELDDAIAVLSVGASRDMVKVPLLPSDVQGDKYQLNKEIVEALETWRDRTNKNREVIGALNTLDQSLSKKDW